MRRVFTLLCVLCAAFTSVSAQNFCTANFSYMVPSNLTVHFSPYGSDSSVQHQWFFGDNQTSQAPAPTHAYASGGSYNVKHVVIKRNSSGTVVCADSVVKTIQLTGQSSCNLVANFGWQIDQSVGNRFHFYITTPPASSPDSVWWNFGDGHVSTSYNPTHTYASAGNYTVCLKIKRQTPPGTPPCVSEVCKVVTVGPTCNLVVGFHSRPDSVNHLKKYFTNTSTPVAQGDSIRWSFGDGSSSTDLNPSHVYAQPGIYNVCLRVKKAATTGGTPCVREFCRLDTVGVACHITPNFISIPDTTQQGVIHFVNTTSSAQIPNASVKWSFGDGTYAYTWHADKQYSQPGTYNVCLRIQTSNTCVREICRVITIPTSTVCNRVVTWTSTPDQNNPRRIFFSNTTPSTMGAIARWTFGDGTTATGWNVIHEYQNAGRYRVCLRIEFFGGCVKEKCDSITVQASSNCLINSRFNSIRSTVDCLRFKFEPAQKNSAWQYHWTFGDGTGSHEMSPEKKYARSGNYNVCLSVYKDNNCASTTCMTVSTGTCINCDSVHLRYVYNRDPSNPHRVAFTAVSNHSISSQVWTISKMPINNAVPPVVLQQNNPVYTFNDTGYYRVCVRAYTAGNCVKEYCEVIRIGGTTSGVCTLQAYPNPASQVITTSVILNAPQMIYTYIYNSSNAIVRQQQQQGVVGNNVISVNIGTLVPGQYSIRVVYGNNMCVGQFQKL
jgi:PKD repeat protein